VPEPSDGGAAGRSRWLGRRLAGKRPGVTVLPVGRGGGKAWLASDRRGRRHCRYPSESSASALRMIRLSPWAATVSVTMRPSAASLTVLVTTISCSGNPMPRN
jgi:hypothetical protein